MDWGDTGASLFVRIDGPSGNVVPRTSTGVAEAPAGSGIYTATLTAPAVGSYQIVWDDGVVYAVDALHVTATEAQDVTDMQDDIEEIKNRIGSSVVVAVPVAAGGEVQVIQGDDYVGAQALSWTSDGWPDFTGKTIHLLVGRTPSLDKTATALSPSHVTVDLLGADTDALYTGMYPYRLVLKSGADVVSTLAEDRFFVR